ncbi:MAG: Hsp20/alpha crystallin family protein [Chitinispirillaceae bacterium]|nr:Hsp20/alpha crystallin family protein [Chitinispirillaceae bacterium]
MAEEKISVSPDVCSYFDKDDKHINIDISLPGVKKEDISLKLLEDSLFLSAPRDDIKYVTTLAICCLIVPEKSVASYNNGLLKITAPFKDKMDGAVEIKVS